ncbi:MAG: peptidase [Bacteroidetes bacterium]|nr:peptidase [Bacteroidota bacterium]
MNYKSTRLQVFLFLLAALFYNFNNKIVAQDSLYIKKITCDLSAPSMFGRGTPYQGELKAAEYIKNELIQLQVSPLGNSYFQDYEIYGYDMSGKVCVVLNGDTLKNFYDYRLPFHTPSINGNFSIIEAPLEMLDYTFGNNVYVFTEKASKKWKKFYKRHHLDFSNQMIYFNMDKIKDLKLDSLTKKRITDNLNNWKIDSTNCFGFKNVLIGTSNLPGFGTRTMPEKTFSFFYIKPEFLQKKKNIIDIHFTNKMGYRKTQNVCGIVPGTHFPDTVILFIGHYDHLGQLGDDCVFRGAFDNASGTAYVLAFAKYFVQHPLKYSTVFVLASGEESGLQGSTYFVNHPLIVLKTVKIVLNFDLLCGGNDGVLFFNGIDSLCTPFLKIMDQVNEKEQIVPKIDKRKNIPNSDHYPFTQKNIPALFALTMGGLKPPTHHPDDICSSCGFDASEKIMKLFIRTLENF